MSFEIKKNDFSQSTADKNSFVAFHFISTNHETDSFSLVVYTQSVALVEDSTWSLAAGSLRVLSALKKYFAIMTTTLDILPLKQRIKFVVESRIRCLHIRCLIFISRQFETLKCWLNRTSTVHKISE